MQSFRERKLDLHSLLEQPLDVLMAGFNEPLLEEMIDDYKGFSSVEVSCVVCEGCFLRVITLVFQETFHWLRRNGFEKYAFHFARYNIPFYALPCVNFFIIDEMGVTHDDQVSNFFHFHCFPSS